MHLQKDYPTHDGVFKEYNKLPHPYEDDIIERVESFANSIKNGDPNSDSLDLITIGSTVARNIGLLSRNTYSVIYEILIPDIMAEGNILEEQPTITHFDLSRLPPNLSNLNLTFGLESRRRHNKNTNLYRKYIIVNKLFNHYFDKLSDKEKDDAIEITLHRIGDIQYRDTSIYYDIKKILENMLTKNNTRTIIIDDIEKTQNEVGDDMFEGPSIVWLYLPLSEITYDYSEYSEINIQFLNDLLGYINSLNMKEYINMLELMKDTSSNYYVAGGYPDKSYVDNYMILYENQREFINRINELLNIIKKKQNYHAAQYLLEEGLNENTYNLFMKRLLLAGDYADAPRLRTKYFWHIYNKQDLFDPYVEFNINLDNDIIINFGKFISENKQK